MNQVYWNKTSFSKRTWHK